MKFPLFRLIFCLILGMTGINVANANWQWANPSNAPIDINDVIWVNKQFVAVGSDGGVRISQNGSSWSDYSTPTNFSLNGVAWNGSQYIAVGGIKVPGKFEHLILSSSDAKKWQIVKSGTGDTLNAVASDGNQFVAVGFNSIMRSGNGSNWTVISSVDVFNDVIWTGSQFIVVGNNGKFLTSSDGENWTSASINTSFNLNSIAYDGSLYVIAASNGTVYTSANLKDWKAVSSGAPSFNNIKIVYSQLLSRFVMVSKGFPMKVLSSTDGEDWSREIQFPLSGTPEFRSIAENDSTIVAMGKSGVTFSSNDGNSWVDAINKVTQTAILRSVIWANNTYVAVGSGFSSQIWTSINAVNWKAFNNGGKVSAPIVDIASNGTVFVTVSGEQGSAARIYTSTDLKNWVLRPQPNDVRAMNGIVWDGKQFVGAGYENSIATSPDGITWTRRDSGVSDTTFHNIYAQGGILVALGGRTGQGVILTSDDGGETWEEQTSYTSVPLYDLAFNGVTYVAVGGVGTATQVILSSTDLVNWSTVISGYTGTLKSIIWDGKQFIAPVASRQANSLSMLTGGTLNSEDGQNWSFEAIPGSYSLNSIVKSDDKLVMVGSKSQVLYFNGAYNPSGDNVAPIVTPPADITIPVGSGVITRNSPEIIAFLSGATATDDVGVVGEITNNAPREFVPGTRTTVTFSAVDAAGNVGTATANVTVGSVSNGDGTTGPVGRPVGAPTTVGTEPSSGGGAAGLFSLLLFFPMLVLRRYFHRA